MPDILVIKPSALGDIVHGLQVIQSLRDQIDGCRISWVVRECYAPLLNRCGAVDEIIIYHRYGGLLKFLSLLREIREHKYDTVIDLQGLARSGLMTVASRSKQKIGRTDAREFSRWTYGKKAPLPEGGNHSHAIEILLQFLPLLHCEPRLSRGLKFNKNQPSSLSHEILDENTLLFFPESQRTEKEWSGFPSLTHKLLKERNDLSIIWCGASRRESPTPTPTERFFNLTGETEIEELAYLISHARLIVANDSGPIHLAAALGVPVVALFGPTQPERFGPYPLDDPQHHVLRAPNGDLGRLACETVFQGVMGALNQSR
jgi:ADP-heptose:LPS heptosyltransferase